MAKIVLDSSNNNPITAAQLLMSHAAGLIAKATEGTSYRDGTLAAQRIAAAKVRVPFGSYVFLHPSAAGSEAEFYLKDARPRPWDIQPVIDAEVADGEPWGKVAARVDACARALEAQGYRPLLYASESFWRQLFAADPRLRRLRVWEAQYPSRVARWLPWLAKWRIRLLHGVTVVLWQFTDQFDVGGHKFDASILLTDINNIRIPGIRKDLV